MSIIQNIQRLFRSIQQDPSIPDEVKNSIGANFNAKKLPQDFDEKDEFGKNILILYALQALQKGLDKYQPPIFSKLFKKVNEEAEKEKLKQKIAGLLNTCFGDQKTFDEWVKQEAEKHLQLANQLETRYYAQGIPSKEISFTNSAAYFQQNSSSISKELGATEKEAYGAFQLKPMGRNRYDALFELDCIQGQLKQTSPFLIKRAKITGLIFGNPPTLFESLSDNPFYYKNYEIDSLVLPYKPSEKRVNPFEEKVTSPDTGRRNSFELK